jgi:hypothetical protein
MVKTPTNSAWSGVLNTITDDFFQIKKIMGAVFIK